MLLLVLLFSMTYLYDYCYCEFTPHHFLFFFITILLHKSLYIWNKHYYPNLGINLSQYKDSCFSHLFLYWCFDSDLFILLVVIFRQKIVERYSNMEDNVDDIKKESSRKIDQLEYKTRQQESKISELNEMVSKLYHHIYFLRYFPISSSHFLFPFLFPISFSHFFFSFLFPIPIFPFPFFPYLFIHFYFTIFIFL